MLPLCGYRVERDVPTTTLAKPPHPRWAGYKNEATLMLPLQGSDRVNRVQL